MGQASPFPAIVLTMLIAAPVCAQRGGGHGWSGGVSGMRLGSGSFSRFSSSEPSREFASPSRSFSPVARTPQFSLRQPFANALPGFAARAGIEGNRYSYRGDRGRRSSRVRVYGVYPFPNFVGYPFGFIPDWLDEYDLDDQTSQTSQDSETEEAPAGPAVESYGPQEPAPPEVAENSEPSPNYRPPYQGAAVASQQVHPQPATTLIFNNGQPSEQVRNYILTGSVLYDLDGGGRREIPTSSIDLPATIQANRSAGVDFALPAKP